MARLGTGAWRIEDGRAIASIALARVPGYSVDLTAETDSFGPPILLPALRFSGGIVEATIRGPKRADWRPTLVLSWRNDPAVATASDAMLLASDESMQRAVRAFWDSLPPMGRGPGAIRDDDQIRRVVAEMRRDHMKVTLKAIAAYSGEFTVDNLRYWLSTRHRKLGDY